MLLEAGMEKAAMTCRTSQSKAGSNILISRSVVPSTSFESSTELGKTGPSTDSYSLGPWQSSDVGPPVTDTHFISTAVLFNADRYDRQGRYSTTFRMGRWR